MFIHKNLVPVPEEDAVEVTQSTAALCCDGTGCSILTQPLQAARAESWAPLALRGTAHWHLPSTGAELGWAQNFTGVSCCVFTGADKLAKDFTNEPKCDMKPFYLYESEKNKI